MLTKLDFNTAGGAARLVVYIRLSLVYLGWAGLVEGIKGCYIRSRNIKISLIKYGYKLKMDL